MTSSFGEVSCQEAHDLASSGARKYLDVRTPEEFEAGHAPGAVNVPFMLNVSGAMQPNADFLKQVEGAFQDKTEPLVVGCKSGRRSAMACERLAAAGYSSLANMEGGFDKWLAEGLPKAVPPAAAVIKRITTKEGHALIKQGATYLDVRTHEEYNTGHAPAAVHVPVAVNAGGARQPNVDFVAQVQAAVPDPATPLCVACMGGARAESAAQQLLAAGYSDVRQMVDGFRGWCANGLPVHKP